MGMQASLSLVVVMGLFNGVYLQGAFYQPPQVKPAPAPVVTTTYGTSDISTATSLGPGVEQTTSTVYETVTVTPTVLETVFDFKTTQVQEFETRTLTQLRNVDIVNTDYEKTVLTLQVTETNRQILPVTSVNTQVIISTEVQPLAETELFHNTATVYVTR